MKLAILVTFLFSLAIASDTCSSVPLSDRIACTTDNGNINAEHCLTNSQCCFEDTGQHDIPPCFFSPGNYIPRENIKKVHVIHSCHLDVGFADSSAGILNEYYDIYYKNVTDIITELKINNTASMKWMTFPYLISLYMDCPEGLGLHCPDAAAKDLVKEAIKRGDIWLAGYPFNGEPETMDATSFTAALDFSRKVALDNGVTRPSVTYNQRDVPGLTAATVPLLAANGLKIITVGTNGLNEAPEVPSVFRWRFGGQEMFVLWHRSGYGGIGLSDCHLVGDEALCPDWNGDNKGPKTAQDIEADFDAIRQTFPNAEVFASTFDDFLPALEKGNLSGSIPVIEEEIGDTWIHGIQADPWKTKAFKAMMRLRTECVSSGDCTEAELANFTRLFIMNNEHTWGNDVKRMMGEFWVDPKNETLYLAYLNSWNNAQLTKSRDALPNFQSMETSWNQQRFWGIGAAVEALGNHPLAAQIKKELASPVLPDLKGFTPITNRNFTFPFGFSIDTDGTFVIEDGNLRVGGFSYRTYSPADLSNYVAQYMLALDGSDSAECTAMDFCKPGLDNATVPGVGTPQSKTWLPTLQKLYQSNNDEASKSTRFVLELDISDFAHEQYGAPSSISVEVNVSVTSLSFDFITVNKTATRLIEAAFVSFAPGVGEFSHEVLGSIVSPTVFSHGSTHLHGAEALRWKSHDHSMRVESLDSGLLCYGEATAFPTSAGTAVNATGPWAAPDLNLGASFNLWNNVWGVHPNSSLMRLLYIYLIMFSISSL